MRRGYKKGSMAQSCGRVVRGSRGESFNGRRGAELQKSEVGPRGTKGEQKPLRDTFVLPSTFLLLCPFQATLDGLDIPSTPRQSVFRRTQYPSDSLSTPISPSLLSFHSNTSPVNPPLDNLKAPPSGSSSESPFTKLDYLAGSHVPISKTLKILSLRIFLVWKLCGVPTGLKTVDSDHPSPALSNTMLAR